MSFFGAGDWDDPIDARHVPRPDDTSFKGQLAKYCDIPPDFRFEVHTCERGLPYTSRVAWRAGVSYHESSKVCNLLADAFSREYRIPRREIIPMSSLEPDGLFIWIRSRVPIPKTCFPTPRENNNLRIEERSGLRSRGFDDPVIDI